jgi:hypothetical protein
MSLTVTWQSYDSTSVLPGYDLSTFDASTDTATIWLDFIGQYHAEWHQHLEAIRHSIIEQQVWAGGDWHQYSPNGVPVLSDGHFLALSWRGWGELLAAVWNTKLGQQFTYIDFYMTGRLPPKPA